jgi:hypothetical protein
MIRARLRGCKGVARFGNAACGLVMYSPQFDLCLL